ncbi:MAG: terminase family protein [Terriglobia bacterium]|jgi:phage FluMu gp28-like protein
MAKGKRSKSPLNGLANQPVDWNKAIPVLRYQWRWIKDNSQLKIAVWSRQSGKSFAAALRAVIKCLEKSTQYIILSKGERQSRLFMEKVKDFCMIFKELKALPNFEEQLPNTDEKTMEVFFPHNRSRIIGLPANPDTARGYTGHIVLDEFAFHGDARRIYAACFPIITRGYSIEVISTPNGTAGKFYEIAKQAGLVAQGSLSSPAAFTDGAEELQGRSARHAGLTAGMEKPQGRSAGPALPGSVWSGHRVDIYDAVAQGLPANIELLRSGCDDEETWLQEYCCQFLSDAQNYIPIELISTCVHEEATTEWNEVPGARCQVPGKPETASLTPDTRHLTPFTRDLYLGVDIGRKRDLTIAWLFEKVGGVLWSRLLLTMKGVTFDEQEKAIFRLLDLGVRRAGFDASGIGMMLAEHAVQKYGAVVEPTTFTAQLKERLAPMVKMAFEERTVRIPDNREVRADINSVKRFVTMAGNVRFDAEHTDRGHADRFWALAMVVNAASEPSAHFDEVAGLVGAPVMAGLLDAIL